jgi:Family of unknown function (DUF6011)
MFAYSKLNGQWIIRGADAGAAGQTVTVTKRNGESKQVALGARVGEGFGYTYYAIAERPAPAAQNVGDLSRIMQLFDNVRAAQPNRRKPPAIVFTDYRINVAGDRAREPGCLTITSPDKGFDGRRKWLGRITRAGQFEPARDTDPALGDKLRAFAADPAGVAGAHGRLTHNCCFCNAALTDERSELVGYGPVCADNFGLPWGQRADQAA